VTGQATAEARGKSNRRRGLDCERALARYLQTQGWPSARRAVVTGDGQRPDPGDLAGLPGIIVSVKDTEVERVDKWMIDLDAMATDDPAALRLLVVKRRRYRPAGWWVHMRLADLLALRDAPNRPEDGTVVRLELGDLLPLLRAAGYAREEAR
jgi:hypothetical protein